VDSLFTPSMYYKFNAQKGESWDYEITLRTLEETFTGILCQ